MKKNWMALLLCVLLLVSVLPVSALAEADDEWLCSECCVQVSGRYCPQCGKIRPVVLAEGESLLVLDIAFEKNVLFSRYDVEVLINGTVAFTMKHGESLIENIGVPQGPCEIVFRLAGSRQLDVRFPLLINRNAILEGTIKTHFYGIEFKSLSCSAPVNEKPLSQGEGGLCNGVHMELVGVKTSSGNNSIRAAQGYEFVMVEFEVYNSAEMLLVLEPAVAFHCYCDGYAIKTSERGALVAPMSFVGGLNGGDKTRGMLCFEVPADWQVLKIIFGNPAVQADNLTFVVKNN